MGQKCLESDRFLGSEVRELKRSIPRILKGIEEAKKLYAARKGEVSSFTKCLLLFKDKLHNLSLEASDYKGYSYEDKMNLLRELKNIYRKKPSSFKVENEALTEVALSQKISQRINEINSKVHDLEKDKLRQSIVSTKSYKYIKQRKPSAVNFELLVREGINDTGLTLGEFVSCAEITNSQSTVTVNYSTLKKSVAISNVKIDNQIFEVTVALEELDGGVFVPYIELSGRKLKGLREKLAIIQMITSGCPRGLLAH